MSNEIIIWAEHVSKLYGDRIDEAKTLLEQGVDKQTVKQQTGVTTALWDISFEVERGKIFVIIGLSGSGKSTLIRCLNRLNDPTFGKLWLYDQEIGELSKKELREFRRNNMSMVFQSFGLMSHRTVLENVAFGLEIRGVSRIAREEKAKEMIRLVGLDGCENQPISSLSGGMKQRVGIARALACETEVLLMDEPFSALDPLVRAGMQKELLEIQRRLKKTVVFITHDMDEAFLLGDQVAIMRDGRIIQVDTPENMAAHPADEYVRNFIDSADRTRVLTAGQVMQPPVCSVALGDTIGSICLKMEENDVGFAFVTDSAGKLLGGVTAKALNGKSKNGSITRDMLDVIPAIAHKDDHLRKLQEACACSKYPIAVVDEDGMIIGEFTKTILISAI